MHLILRLALLCGIQSVLGQDDAIACNSSSRPAVRTNYTGRITSPGFPNNYPNNANCEWRITNPETNGTLMIDFPVIQTESGESDFVKVCDGDTVTANGTLYSGNFTSVPTMFSTQQHLFLIFASDTNIRDVGFEAKYTRETACREPRELDTPSGWFSSPYFPEYYTANKTCEWRLTIDADEFVELRFDAFDVGIGDTSCSLGSLNIKQSNETRQLCGASKPDVMILLSSTSFMFTSPVDMPSNASQGFIAYYRLDFKAALSSAATSDSTTSVSAAAVSGAALSSTATSDSTTSITVSEAAVSFTATPDSSHSTTSDTDHGAALSYTVSSDFNETATSGSHAASACIVAKGVLILLAVIISDRCALAAL